MGRRFSRSLGRKTHGDPQVGISTLDEVEALTLIDDLKEEAFILLLDHVQDPRNLGACLRTADGAGVNAVVIPSDRSAGITDVVRHVAAGAAEALSLIKVRNLARFMDSLKLRSVRLVGTSDMARSSVFEVDLRGPLGIVMGAEGKGIRRLTASYCDDLINIPMFGSVNCLNVSVATGVCLYEACRQRTKKN